MRRVARLRGQLAIRQQRGVVSAALPQAGDVTATSQERLALRLRLGEKWQEALRDAEGSLASVYDALLATGRLQAVEGQAAATRDLARLPAALAEARERRRSWEAEQVRLTALAAAAAERSKDARLKAATWDGEGWIKGSPSTPKAPAVVGPMCWLSVGPPPAMQPAGCYLHGSVGSGKSTLMDLFCLFGLKGWRVRRQHFHEFSVWLHENLHSLGGPQATSQGGSSTPRKHVLARLVDMVAQDTDAICLDEFAITNVADAAIFAEVLRLLAARHVLVVCTTNRPPEDLYKDGLHRERYVPALVEHFNGKFIVAPVTGTDFRAMMFRSEADALGGSEARSGGEAAPKQVFFEGGCAETALSQALPCKVDVLSPGSMKVSWGRQLIVPGMDAGVARFHFDDLCRRALAAEDFLHIAMRFHTVYVHNVPKLTLEEHNEARRFTNLVDALYEHSVRLVCHSDVPLGDVLRSVEALREASAEDGHDADRLGLFETMYDDQPNFQIQIKELGSRAKWQEMQDRHVVEEQRSVAARLGRMAQPEAAAGTTGSGWSVAPSASDLSAPDQGVAGVMVAAVGSLQESGFAARRAVSRLKEMQTKPYLEAARQRRDSMMA